MNNFELIGRVNYINIKWLDSGKCVTRVLLAKKTNNTGDNDVDYSTFPVTFFDNKNANTAQMVGENIHKGDYLKATGKLNVSKFKSKTGEDVERIELIGFTGCKVVYDEDKRAYVEVKEDDTAKYSTKEKTVTAELVMDDEEIPF